MIRKTMKPPRIDKVKDPRSVKKFIEELSWLLNTHSHLDFRALPEMLEGMEAKSPRKRGVGLNSFVSKNPNIHFLIGVLPGVLSNETMFGSNEDIADFARSALKLQITRSEKRSKYELIGLIVCEAAKLDDFGLTQLVRALTKLLSNDPSARKLFHSKQHNQSLSWNEIIQRLTNEE